MAESLRTSPKQRWRKRYSIEDPPSLRSSGPLGEELQCSVCLDVFTDPVSTPCGHNFCKSCLNECWDNSQNCYCPLCKETFTKRPDLKINTAFRQVVQLFKEKFSVRKSEDICDGKKTSYSENHLELHQKTSLKKHELIDPMKYTKDYICQKHKRPLELFCRDDQTFVCVFCTDGDHKTHNTVPLETQLMKTKEDMQQMIQDRIKKIQDIEHSAELRKKSTEQETAASIELLSALMRSIERCQAELLDIMEEQQKAAEKQHEELIQELQREIAELKMRSTELEQLSHTEDHLHLLQIDPSLWSPPPTRNWSEISMKTGVSVETLRIALTQLQNILNEKLTQNVLNRMQHYAVDLTLDPDTAHPRLVLSDDKKQVRFGDIIQNLPNNPERFDCCGSVLGKEGFSTGRFYFEVQVKGMTHWDIGVVRESLNRKGPLTACPQNGEWTVSLRNENQYIASDSPPVRLSLNVKPQTVGVFVDYEEGLVCFYNVESRCHMYSFTGQSFIEKLYPAFSPEFSEDGKSSTPLIISPVNSNK